MSQRYDLGACVIDNIPTIRKRVKNNKISFTKPRNLDTDMEENFTAANQETGGWRNYYSYLHILVP